MTKLDDEIDGLIRRHGVADVLAAICRWAHARGSTTLSNKLNRVYEWLVDKPRPTP